MPFPRSLSKDDKKVDKHQAGHVDGQFLFFLIWYYGVYSAVGSYLCTSWLAIRLLLTDMLFQVSSTSHNSSLSTGSIGGQQRWGQRSRTSPFGCSPSWRDTYCTSWDGINCLPWVQAGACRAQMKVATAMTTRRFNGSARHHGSGLPLQQWQCRHSSAWLACGEEGGSRTDTA